MFILCRWVVIFSHPADFTPVCTTELGRIAVHQPYFEKRNTKLLAHSVDKLKDHVDWVNVSLFNSFVLVLVNFPNFLHFFLCYYFQFSNWFYIINHL